MNRRHFLKLTSLTFAGLLFPARTLLSEESAPEEVDPRYAFYGCPHVDAEAQSFISNHFSSNLACCDACLDLLVGNVGVNLYDTVSWVDNDPAQPGLEVQNLRVSARNGVSTLGELRARDLEGYGFTATPHEQFEGWQLFKLNGHQLSHILHVVQDNFGRRFLSYPAYVPDDWRWYNDPIKKGLVGWVLGAQMINLSGEKHGCFNDKSSKECLSEGCLRFRASALIMLD